MRGLLLGLAATLLVGVARAEEPSVQTVVEGTGDGTIRITNSDGLVLECRCLTLFADQFDQKQDTMIIEPALGGQVTLVIIEGGVPGKGDRRAFTGGTILLSSSTPRVISFSGPGSVTVETDAKP